MLGPFLDTGGVSEKMTDNMGSHSYRLRVCSIDIKSREIAVWAWESSGKGAFEAVKCKGPAWDQAELGELHSLLWPS